MTAAGTLDQGVSAAAPLRRRPQIDGLRALAMVGVLYVHLYDKSPLTEGLRVSLFFVVSGFIITHILTNAKERGGQINILNFYVRRALRLFPALSILVLCGVIFDIDGFRSSALWHLAQMTNLYFLKTELYKPWIVGHIWSLNVLEQFYLIWPPVILLLSLRNIYTLTIAIIVVMSFVRANAYELGLDWYWSNLVFASGPIAFGAFAYLLQRNPAIRDTATTRLALVTSLGIFASPLVLWDGFGASATYYILCMPALAVVVTGAFAGYRGPVGWLLASPVSSFLSKISYGVYIYHVLVWWAVGSFYPELLTPGPVTFLLVSSLTLVFATLSWHLIEEPISRLKDRFPTSQRALPQGGGVPAADQGGLPSLVRDTPDRPA